MMNKDLAPSPHRMRRIYTPMLGASSSPSRIPGLSSRSLGAGELTAFKPVLKKDTGLKSLMQNYSTKPTPASTKSRGIPRPNFRIEPSKEPQNQELLTSCLHPTTSQDIAGHSQRTEANDLAPRKQSSISFTLRRSSSIPPPGPHLLLHSVAKREFQKIPLRKEALTRREQVPVSSSKSPSSRLPTLTQSVTGSCSKTQATSYHNGENSISETKMPDSHRSLTLAAPPSPQPDLQTIEKESMVAAAAKEDLTSSEESHVPQGLAESGKRVLPSPPLERLERQDGVGHFFKADPMISPQTNSAGLECKLQN